MGILDFLVGQFIDVIHWTSDDRTNMVWRFEREGHEIKYGAKLTVREGQAAVFIHEGILADVFKPGLYQLETNNMPIMTSLQHWSHAFQSPFKAEIYFVNTTRFTDQKWGTKNPIICRDPEFGMVRLRAFGSYSVRVIDPGKFMTEIVGTDGDFTTDEITYQIRNIIVQEFSRAIASAAMSVLDMAANTDKLGALVSQAIAPVIAQYGIELPEFYIENISLPPAVEEALDKRTSMGMAGDLTNFARYSQAEAMTLAAKNQNAMGASIGMMMGGGMAGPWGAPAAGAPATPPPVPTDGVWHVAVDGASTGPFSRANMGRMVASGELKRETLVWTPGQDGWKSAGEITELAQLFTVQPPPPPVPPKS
jgi:membrane protease subunit (stomatin/prohibitin family)